MTQGLHFSLGVVLVVIIERSYDDRRRYNLRSFENR